MKLPSSTNAINMVVHSHNYKSAFNTLHFVHLACFFPQMPQDVHCFFSLIDPWGPSRALLMHKRGYEIPW